MAYPTNAQIDEAVPVAGTPNRAKTNAALKAIVGAASYTPEDGTVPTRSVANENFSGGRMKTAMGTDPDDCVNLQQLKLEAVRRVSPAPLTATSPGERGTTAIDDEYFYLCVEANTWRRISMTEW